MIIEINRKTNKQKILHIIFKTVPVADFTGIVKAYSFLVGAD